MSFACLWPPDGTVTLSENEKKHSMVKQQHLDLIWKSLPTSTIISPQTPKKQHSYFPEPLAMVHCVHLDYSCYNWSESLGYLESCHTHKCAQEPPVSCCHFFQLSETASWFMLAYYTSKAIEAFCNWSYVLNTTWRHQNSHLEHWSMHLRFCTLLLCLQFLLVSLNKVVHVNF